MEIYDLDTSILLEIIFEQPRMKKAKELLHLSTYRNRYLLHLSIIALGEAILIINREEDPVKRNKYLFALSNILSSPLLKIYVPSPASMVSILPFLKELDSYLDPADTLILAAATSNFAKKFYTFDQRMLKSSKLPSNLSLEVLEP